MNWLFPGKGLDQHMGLRMVNTECILGRTIYCHFYY